MKVHGREGIPSESSWQGEDSNSESSWQVGDSDSECSWQGRDSNQYFARIP